MRLLDKIGTMGVGGKGGQKGKRRKREMGENLRSGIDEIDEGHSHYNI